MASSVINNNSPSPIVPGMVVAGSSVSPSTSTASGGLIVGTAQAQIYINQGKSLRSTLANTEKRDFQCTNNTPVVQPFLQNYK